jgi:large repetitive protein
VFSQSAQNLQVTINANPSAGRFCSGTLKSFILDAAVSGGTAPYKYEWTFSWKTDTIRDKTIPVLASKTGTVTLRVTDSSHPTKTEEKKFQILEKTVTADFIFAADSACAQTPVNFIPKVSGGTPDYRYTWNFGDYNISNEKGPSHEFIASGCSGFATFNVRLEVWDADGCYATVEKVVTVRKKPFLNFLDIKNTATPFKHCPEILSNEPTFQVILKNNSQDTTCITGYKIDWGDGSPIVNSATFPAPHTYSLPGAFKLIVTAGNANGCDVVWVQNVYNQSSPAVGIESFGGTEGCAPIKFKFRLRGYENNSIGTTYTWDFGDGSIQRIWNNDTLSVKDTIEHSYVRSSCVPSENRYWFNTWVTVKNGCDEKMAMVDRVRIWTKPVASIDDGPITIDTICVNEPIKLVNNSTNGYYGNNCSSRPDSLKWDFGNGTSSTSEQMPLTAWAVPGGYDVVLNIKNACGLAQDTFRIEVIDPPKALGTFNATEGCAPFKPEFTNKSTGSKNFLWEVRPDSGYTYLDGTSKKSMQPKFKFEEAGSYKVVLFVTNECKSDSAIFTIKVFDKPIGGIKNIGNVCITNPVIHPSVVYNDFGSPITSFNWTFTGGSLPTASTKDPGEHTYISAGEYVVNLILENSCGSLSLTEKFNIHPKPEVSVKSPVTICESDNLIITQTTITNVISKKWTSLGDGYFENDTLLNPIYHPGPIDLSKSGTDLRIIATGIAPCSPDTAIVTLKIQKKPTVRVDNSVTICEGKEYTIFNTTASNYDALVWKSSGDGHFSDPSIMLPVYYPGANDISTGQVTLTLTARAVSPCSVDASASFVITYARVPSVNAGADQDICQNGQVSLNASGTGFTTVSWSIVTGSGSFSNASGLNTQFTVSPGFTGSKIVLSIEARGGFGCPTVYDTVNLKVVPLPVVFAGDDAIVCESGTHEITGASANEYLNYSWIVNGDGTLNSNSVLNPVYTPGTSDISKGWVTLTLTAKGNSVCPDVFDETKISIQKLPVSHAGNDQEVCKSNNYTTTGSQVNGVSFEWTSLGTGTFQNGNNLITTYYPSVADKDNGSVQLVLKVNAIPPCLSAGYDTVKLIFIDPPVISAGNDTTICSSSFTPGNAYALNSTQFVWSSNGSGTWKDETTLTPVYYPSAADVSKGSVILTLTSSNPTCPIASDAMVLNLTPFPVSEAGRDDLICEDAGKLLSDSNGSNYSSLEWKTSGDGSFSDKTILHPVYSPGVSDKNSGSVKLYLVVSGIAPCSKPAIDSMTLSIQKNPVVFAGNDAIIGEREVFTATGATAQNFNQLSWSTMGDGTFQNGSAIICSYTHGENDLKNKGVKLIIRATSYSPCIKVVTDTIYIVITPKPVANAGKDERICEGSDVTVSTATAEEYSEIWWTATGTGLLENGSTLTPVYHPTTNDIGNRKVMLVLHARGKDPITNIIALDTMEVSIIHNAFAGLKLLDTACVNSDYQIRDVIYKDVNSISWSSSGDGYFNGTKEDYPVYSFSSNDKKKDTIYFYVEVSSISPCLQVWKDTALVRLYHEPVTSFNYDKPEGCAPLKVNFTNTSEGEELKYFWNFDNGLTSSYKEPGEIVFKQGIIADTTYKVTLKATNRCSTVSAVKDVIVKPVPITDFGMDVAWGCSPKEIHFFNVTTGLPDTYQWKWGDGKAGSTAENPGSHIFVTGIKDTTYTITLIARNECGVDSVKKSVIIFPNKVQAFFETDTIMGCAPLKVSFKNYSRGVLGNRPFLNWSWNFGDGNVSDELHPVHTFNKPGNYKVTLYVNDTCSYDSFTTEINVMGPINVDFVTDKESYCEGDTVFVTPVNMPVAEIANVTWDFGDLKQGFNFNDKHVYDKTGTFTITLTAKNIINGCIASISKQVKIIKSPDAAFSLPVKEGCQPLQVTFQNNTTGGDYFIWDFGNGNKSIDLNGKQIYTSHGKFNIVLKATNAAGCSDTAIQSVKVNPKPVAAFSSSSLQTCFPPVDVKLTNNSEGADDYNWNLGNGKQSKDTDPGVTYNKAGDYPISLIATNMYNCSDTSELIYHAYNNPVAAFSVSSPIGCDPFKVVFDNKSEYGIKYYWIFGDNTYSADAVPEHTFNGKGIYTVSLKVTGGGDCADSITKRDFITTNPSPVSDFDYTRINDLDTIEFHNHSSGAISYLWNFGDGQTSVEDDPWHRYFNYGKYTVSLTTENEYKCTNVKIDTIDFKLFKGLFMPSALSPGNQSAGVREFKAIGTGLIEFDLVVYDTWGNLIWETTRLDGGKPAEGWDGTLKGKPLPPDVYVWHLKKAVFKDGRTFEGQRYGSITLIK